MHTGAEEILVSVITPAFGSAGTIGAAIASVHAQSLGDWELIVVDDGSTDNTGDAVRDVMADSRMHLVTQERAGPAEARNRGIHAARGTLVAFLDADDLWTPHYLRTMTSALAGQPGAALAFGSWQYIDEEGDVLPQRVTPFNGDAHRAATELPWRNAIVTSAVVVRRSALARTGGFDPSLRACEDWDLWLRLRSEGEFVAVPGALALYRAHSASLTEDVETMERERLRLNEKHHGPISGDLSLWPFDRRRAVGHTLFVSGLAHLRRRDDRIGRQRVRRALEVWPGLADQHELYYELACARQPRGWRGATPALDLTESANLIQWVLPETGGRPLPALAYTALGNLALLSGDRRAARLHARAGLRRGSWRTARTALKLLVTASLPPRVSRRLREWRSRRHGSAPTRRAFGARRTAP